MPLLRSDEAQSVARELLYLMLDLDLADAEGPRRSTRSTPTR